MKTDRGLLIVLIGILAVLSFLLVRPYLQFVLAAIVLAFVLHPLHVRLAPRVGETPSALVLLLFSVVALVLPFFLLAAFIAGDFMRLLEAIEEGDLDFETVETPIENVLGLEVDFAAAVRSALEGFGTFDGVLSAFGTLTHLLVGLGLLLFLLFFLIRDSERMVAWLTEMSPLEEAVTDDLAERFSAITKAVLVGHVLVAIVQGVAAGIALFATGVPNAGFWTLIMIVLALIPIIGTFVIWAPASVWLFLNGDVVAAVALFAFGTVLVGLSDDYLRPIIVDRYAQVSPSVVIIGVIGGLSVFGFMGLFVGPIVVGALKETVEVYNEHFEQPDDRAAG